ncbi:MAG: DUF3237 domain-containing protein [Polyangiaceae bacterium]
MKLPRRDLLFFTGAALIGCARPPRAAGSPTAPTGAAMKTRPLFTLRLEIGALEKLPGTPAGDQVAFPVIGGHFEGERLRGKVLPGGADWTVERHDGVLELDLRITLETHDGALIAMTFTGVRDDARAYLRTLPRFETAAPEYAFLNRLLAVGVGEIDAEGPRHVIEEIL